MNKLFNVDRKKWQLFPFVLGGLILFVINSNLELNYFAKGYLTILEIQTLALLFYFLIAKYRKKSSINN